jgi:hypothetical protein
MADYGDLGVYPQNQIADNTTLSSPFVTATDVVYFRGTDNKLWRVNSGGSDQFQIGRNTTNARPFVFADPATGEWVYFQGTDDRLLKVRGDPDGSDLTRIGENSTKSTPFVALDSSTGDVWVYFQGTDNRLLKVKSDGTGESQIGDNSTKSTPFVTDDGWVYFQGTDDKLWRVRSDGSDQSQLDNNTTSSTPAVGRMQHIGYRVGRWVYFRGTDDKLWRIFQADDLLTKEGKKQPERILEIQYTNPEHQSVTAPIAQIISFGREGPPHELIGGSFPSWDAQQEWKQVLPTDLTNTAAHEADYEGPNLVGASGWVLNPECSGADVPFSHPFGLDWEFMLALDQPAADTERYTFLLTRGNQSCEDGDYKKAVQQATTLTDPQGPIIIPTGPDGLPSLLGIEIDGGLVPQQFIESVVAGDRIAAFGRWIVDCGHQLPITECGDGDNPNKVVSGADPAFKTEIHPPLLMAAARVTTGSIASGTGGGPQGTPGWLLGPEATRVLFCSRPYLVGQRFTIDTNTIWDDSAPDDGSFMPHLLKEFAKVNTIILGIPIESVQVEMHPKIKSQPFSGVYSTHFVLRSPLVFAHHHGTPVPPARIVVSYQFTVRSGCRVQVTSSAPDSVDVVITLDSNGLLPAPRPHRRERVWDKDELDKFNPTAKSVYTGAEFLSAALQEFVNTGIINTGTGLIDAAEATVILGRGIKTDQYEIDDLRNVNILDTSHAVTAPGDNIPAEQGVVLNDDQPFPVYGWLEIIPMLPDLGPLNVPV